MAAEPRLNRAKPFITVFGDHEYSFKQGNRCFDAFGNFLKTEGEEPKVEDPDVTGEMALRAKIRAEIEAEMAAAALPKKAKA
jgi:hypothetical protein